MTKLLIILAFALSTVTAALEKDTIRTSAGSVEITFIGHGSMLLTHASKTIYVDPFGMLGDYGAFPKADIILVTHDHGDHLDVGTIDKIRKKDTQLIATALCSPKLPGAVVMKNGESRTIGKLKIDAVPAYNIRHMRDNGLPFHPKGEGNGYVLTIGGTRIYVAGDTDDIPEMSELKKIDIAFLPMNLPYTMTPEEAAAAARMVMPKILYPYHFGETDTKKLVELLKSAPGIEVRIRSMK